MEKLTETTRSMSGIDQSFPYYVTRVYFPNGDLQKEHVFQEPENDLMKARSKAYARFDFEIDQDLPREIEVFICQWNSGVKTEFRLKSLSDGNDRAGLNQEVSIHSGYNSSDWTTIEKMYDEELEKLENTENLKMKALTAVEKIDQALQELYSCESVFQDDHWLFDWYTVLSARTEIFKSELEDRMNHKLNSAA